MDYHCTPLPEVSGCQFNTVLAKELYYTPYQVKVQPINDLGRGPNSSIEVVYSSEDSE